MFKTEYSQKNPKTSLKYENVFEGLYGTPLTCATQKRINFVGRSVIITSFLYAEPFKGTTTIHSHTLVMGLLQ